MSRKLIFSTRTADCYIDSDESGQNRLWRWEMKFPLEPDTEAARSFKDRLETIAMPDLPRLPIKDHGLDLRGIGFVTLLHRETQPLSLQRLTDPATLFINLVETVSKFHERGIFLGDICGVSFVLDGTGRVLLSAMLGSYDYSARGTSLIPPRETLFYIAPEQRAVASPTSGCDIYALGVMGYRLITGRFPQGNKPERFLDVSPVENALAPSELVPNCPQWVDRVIARCLATDVSERYLNCKALLEDTRADMPSVTPSPNWLRRRKTVHFAMPGSGITLDRSIAGFHERPSRIFLLAGLLTIAGGAAYFATMQRDEARKVQALQNAVERTIDEGGPDIADRREQMIKQIVASDDPVSKFILGSWAVQHSGPQAKQEAAAGLINYFERRNKLYIVSALAWLLQLAPDQFPSKDQMRLILEICDERYTSARRIEKLRLLHGQDIRKSAVFFAALDLGGDIEGSSSILKQWLQELGDQSSNTFYTTVALTLGSNELRHIFSGRTADLVAELHPEEATKMLELQRGEDSKLILHLAARAKSENLYPPFQELIVEQIMAAAGREEKASAEIYLQALAGKITTNDLTKIVPCSDDKAAEALLSMFILNNDPALTEAYLRTIQRCIPENPLAHDLLSGRVQSPSSLLKALAIVALGSKTDYAELDPALSAIIPAPPRDDILKTIFVHGERRLIGLTLERVGGALSSEYLLTLAKHPNPGVRSRVVAILVRRNDANVDQPLADLMTEEQDRSVLAEYRSGSDKR